MGLGGIPRPMRTGQSCNAASGRRDVNKYVNVTRFLAQFISQHNMKYSAVPEMQYEPFPDDSLSEEQRNRATKKIIADKLEVLLSPNAVTGNSNSYYGPCTFGEVPPVVMNEVVEEIAKMPELSVYKQAQGNWGIKMLVQQRMTSKNRSYKKRQNDMGQLRERQCALRNTRNEASYHGSVLVPSTSSEGKAVMQDGQRNSRVTLEERRNEMETTSGAVSAEHPIELESAGVNEDEVRSRIAQDRSRKAFEQITNQPTPFVLSNMEPVPRTIPGMGPREYGTSGAISVVGDVIGSDERIDGNDAFNNDDDFRKPDTIPENFSDDAEELERLQNQIRILKNKRARKPKQTTRNLRQRVGSGATPRDPISRPRNDVGSGAAQPQSSRGPRSGISRPLIPHSARRSLGRR